MLFISSFSHVIAKNKVPACDPGSTKCGSGGCSCPARQDCCSNGGDGCCGSGGDSGGGGGPPPCDANAWGGWSGCSTSCGAGSQSNTNQCGTVIYQGCMINDPNVWTSWSACTGIQNTQSRTNNCGTVETLNCPRVTGTIYYDPYNSCAADSPSNLALPLTVTYNGSYKVNAASNGTFSILTGPAGSGTLLLEGLSGNFECSTCNPQGCPLVSSTISPTNGNNFFIADRANPWWQTKGAGIYVGSESGGTTLVSNIPRYVPADQRYLILPGAGLGVAALLRASGGVSYGRGTVSSGNLSAVSKYTGKRVDYSWFSSRVGLTFSQPNDWGADTMNQPVNDPTKAFYYITPASGTATVLSPWHVLEGEKYIVIVNGDLKVEQNIIVDVGGFVAFVVKNGVKVATNVTKLDGLYEMDGTFETLTTGAENDVQLVTGGSVVAWGGVSLNRNIGKTNNASTPSEQFVYRQDLITNMPKEMKTFIMSWTEVPAGTFEN